MTENAEPIWTLDPRLERDTIVVGDLPLSRVLLIDDATYPWLLLVPRQVGASELTDLDRPARVKLMDEIAQVSETLGEATRCDKINVAALGNVVAQLHVHVIARYASDPAWPKPVWGALPARPYDAIGRERMISALRQALSPFGIKEIT